MSLGSHVVFTLLGDGSLRQVLGLFVDHDDEFVEEEVVSVAIPTGIVGTDLVLAWVSDLDCKSAVGVLEVSVVRVASGEGTEDCRMEANRPDLILVCHRIDQS